MIQNNTSLNNLKWFTELITCRRICVIMLNDCKFGEKGHNFETYPLNLKKLHAKTHSHKNKLKIVTFGYFTTSLQSNMLNIKSN